MNEWLESWPIAPGAVTATGALLLIVLAFVKDWISPKSAVEALRTRHAEDIADLRAQRKTEMDTNFAKAKADTEALTANFTRQLADLREDSAYHIRVLREDRDARIGEYQREVADWREAYKGMEMALAAVRAQNGELLELARTSERALASLPRDDGSDRDD